jgi:hypothetical protein
VKTRSWREAIEDGTAFDVRDAKGRGATFPAAETVEEAVTFSVHGGFVREGDEVEVVRHLPGSRTGAAIVEPVWRGRASAVRDVAAAERLETALAAAPAAPCYSVQVFPDVVLLRDAHEGRTVVGEAESIVASCAKEGLLTRRVLYRGDAGMWNELRHDGARLVAVRELRALSAAEAMAPAVGGEPLRSRDEDPLERG